MRAPRSVATSALVCVLASCQEGADRTPTTGPQPPGGWQAFSIEELRAQREQRNTSFFEFLTEASFRAGLYHLPAGGNDGQSPHGQDEIYYVMAGTAALTVGGVEHEVVPGAVFFVRAGVDHRFHSITSDLDVVVVFASGSSSSADPAALAYAPSDLVSGRDATQNVWDPLLTVATMSLGMYMLPRASGGDGMLTHEVDELNIVVNGSSRFEMDGDVIDVRPGSIVFVERRVRHRFVDLTEDVDVLIFWKR